MKWSFKKDRRVLVFPIIVFSISCFLSFEEQLIMPFRLLIVLWSLLYFVHFYCLHLLKNLEKSCEQIQFSDDNFQIYKDGEWIEVILASNSLVSYWLLALQWKSLDNEQLKPMKSYSLLIFPSAMSEFEFKNLVKLLLKVQT